MHSIFTTIYGDMTLRSPIRFPGFSWRHAEASDKRPSESVRLRRSENRLNTFEFISWLSATEDGRVRSYHVPQGVLLCSGATVRLLVRQCGHSIDFDGISGDCASISDAIAGLDVGLPIAALLRGNLVIRASSVLIEGTTVAIVSDSIDALSRLLPNLQAAGAVLLGRSCVIIDANIRNCRCYACDTVYENPNSATTWNDDGLGNQRSLRQPRALSLGCLFVLKPLPKPDHPAKLFLCQAWAAEAETELLSASLDAPHAAPFLDLTHFRTALSNLSKRLPVFVISYASNSQCWSRLLRVMQESAAIYSSSGL